MQKRLYRSRRDHIIAGIAGGLGDYFDIDPTIVRLVLLLLVFPGGAAFFLYIIGWVIIPPAPGNDVEPSTMFAKSEALRRKMLHGAKQVEARLQRRKEGEQDADSADAEATSDSDGDADNTAVMSTDVGEAEPVATAVSVEEEEAVGGPPDTSEEDERARRQKLGGIVLIGVGFLFVLRDMFPAITLGSMWPLFIIGLGVLLILRGLSE